jgi:TonB family protein
MEGEPTLNAGIIGVAILGLALLCGATNPPPHPRWRTQEDYPAAALAGGQHGSVIMAIDVSEQGTVDDCRILRSTGSELLDRASCDTITRKARYPISYDASGKPKRLGSTFVIHWVFLGMTQSEADLPIGPQDLIIAANPHLAPGERGKPDGGGSDAERLAFPSPKYPGKALKENREGRSHVLLSIDRRGRVDRCSVIRTSGSTDLDQATCDFARSSLRYAPARNGLGKPTPSYDTFNINWVIAIPAY